MNKEYIYPKNKRYFKNLIYLTQKIIKICHKNKIYPIIYGSFAHFYHTKDKELYVNDIDMLVPKKKLYKLSEILKKNRFKTIYLPEWKTISVEKNKLRVEIDGIGFWYKDLDKSPIFKYPEDIDF
jgi:hypothetical protein